MTGRGEERKERKKGKKDEVVSYVRDRGKNSSGFVLHGKLVGWRLADKGWRKD